MVEVLATDFCFTSLFTNSKDQPPISFTKVANVRQLPACMDAEALMPPQQRPGASTGPQVGVAVSSSRHSLARTTHRNDDHRPKTGVIMPRAIV